MTTSTITTEPMWVDSLTPTPITCSLVRRRGRPPRRGVRRRPVVPRPRAPRTTEPRGAGLLNDGTREPEYVTVHPVKDVGGEPTVYLGKGESAGVRLLPDEAESLARQLLIVAAQIRDAARAGATR